MQTSSGLRFSRPKILRPSKLQLGAVKTAKTQGSYSAGSQAQEQGDYRNRRLWYPYGYVPYTLWHTPYICTLYHNYIRYQETAIKVLSDGGPKQGTPSIQCESDRKVETRVVTFLSYFYSVFGVPHFEILIHSPYTRLAFRPFQRKTRSQYFGFKQELLFKGALDRSFYSCARGLQKGQLCLADQGLGSRKSPVTDRARCFIIVKVSTITPSILYHYTVPELTLKPPLNSQNVRP